MPKATTSGFFGRILKVYFADRTAKSSRGNGNTMIFGEKDLSTATFDFGTAV
jgi:hypothetical protein